MTNNTYLPRWRAVMLLVAGLALPAFLHAAAPAKPAIDPGLDKSVCLGCHGNEGFATTDAEGKPRALHMLHTLPDGAPA